MKIEFSSNDEGYHGVGIHLGDKEYWAQLLPRSEWHFGLKELWYDGPIKVVGCGFFEILWHYQM